MSLEAFREETRAWLEENCPASMRTPMPADETPNPGRRAQFKNPDTKVWLDLMAEKGWTVPHWPTEYGGGGLSIDENAVLREEMARIKARTPLFGGMGTSMIGPALLEFGTEEQKKEHLPRICRGDIWWCQGYSEPNSGSDLASLQTKAVVDGDEYVINGQKIWTSGADNADWIFCLVRTDFDAPKHDGITFVLFDMDQPGVEVKPIKLISGLSPFCETYFTDARALRNNVVGEVNRGWTVAKRLLQYERTSIGGGMGGAGGGGLGKTLGHVALERYGEADGKVADSTLRDEISTHIMNDRAFGLTVRRNGEESRTTTAPTFASSMFKLYGTEQNKNRLELLMKILGTQMLGWEGDQFEEADLGQTRAWLRSKANSIEGGTSEVQYNIIAKRVLGLPD
ncbi:MAG: acyl-CoA dehydrogenase [Gammaproteobacteria bacterium]|nr:acyl-CoA dehydrogenase [Gammaproteobacteria bacterium]|tara:strand:- start:660 stop:1853 length:1194 start_codon:yes stop_codon:yes gene_type:complete